MMRKPLQHPVNHDRWLVSYADFITLLFAFFVVMYSAAQLDKRRAGQLATAIQTAFLQHGSLPDKPSEIAGIAPNGVPSNLPVGNTDDTEFNMLRNQIENALAGEIAAGDVVVGQSGEGLVVNLREIGFFDTGSDEINASSAGAFARLAGVLQQTDREIRVEGHTDNVPIHNARFSSNWDLSAARATATVRMLILRFGLRPETLGAAGYAEYHPVASNATPEGRAANRRVDVVIPKKHD
jgi:chemotaxis protein MotB